jgi:hypothetical protein
VPAPLCSEPSGGMVLKLTESCSASMAAPKIYGM